MSELTKQFGNFGEDFWNTLTKEEQLKCFCAVSRRIYIGSVMDQGSFRHVLYDTFGFGSDSYIPAQLAGFLSINNLIFDAIENEQYA